VDEQTSNDNEPGLEGRRPEPDAHGQAAILLVESLIHGLVARAVLSIVDAMEIVEVAAEVKADIAAELGDSSTTLRASLTILESISASLRLDAPGE